MHLQYVPFWALLGLAIMIAGCAVFSTAVSPRDHLDLDHICSIYSHAASTNLGSQHSSLPGQVSMQSSPVTDF